LGARLEAAGSIPEVPGKPHAGATSLVGSSNLISPEGTLNMATLRAEGAKAKALSHRKFQEEVDHIIMRLICVRGLVPNVIDSPEWKELMLKLNGIYKPTSGDVFRDQHIPKEAAFVRNRQIEILKKEENLTLTFDGTTIRKPESFYTAHATTPLRATYFLDGHGGTGEHHNTEWIVDKLLKVCRPHECPCENVKIILQTITSIGAEKWAATVSDSTNVTKVARRETSQVVKTMLDLRDSVHHIQLTIKDVTTLEEFKPVSEIRDKY
jgi:hypothetical protein